MPSKTTVKTTGKGKNTSGLKRGPGTYSKENQPTPEAKSKGWDRKKEAKKIMDKLLEFTNMTMAELDTMLKKLGTGITVRDRLLSTYLSKALKDEKVLLDRLDRHISKAPSRSEIDMTPLEELSPEQKASILARIKGNG